MHTLSHTRTHTRTLQTTAAYKELVVMYQDRGDGNLLRESTLRRMKEVETAIMNYPRYDQ
jgi:hypothetical protein